MLVDKGFISHEKGKELLEFGDVEGVYHTLDETAAKEENQRIIAGDAEVVAELWEDHTIHAKVHTDFMKTKKYYELPPEVRERFKQHYAQHQEYIRLEAQAAAGAERR